MSRNTIITLIRFYYMANPNETILSAVGYYDSPDLVAIEEALRFVPREGLSPAQPTVVFNAHSADTMRVVHNHLGGARPNIEEVPRHSK